MSSETLPKSFAVQGYPVNSGPTRSNIPGANHDFSGKVRSPQHMLQPPSDVTSRGTLFPCASAPIPFSPIVSRVQMLASLEEACCSDSRSDTRAAATPVPDLRQAAQLDGDFEIANITMETFEVAANVPARATVRAAEEQLW
ncbi:hypothetical protein D7B24_002661 [Verticillium nonalfalfae]|uniref:Uncharacterized protein n=1 Tax=Verticillium nonalfalfae TaxID=1051616 RepID=A0A3M9XXC7_9PEZI|nr:uncharacterized protein D7B24_002661 [Verticillium nonalfalfae]RNJ52903.1 hypothetical protein D7B24_002661 [Verticillium nonalfalfae]